MSWPRPWARQHPRDTAEDREDIVFTPANTTIVHKARSPDGIPTVAVKVAIKTRPGMFRNAMQMCLDEDESRER